MPDGVFSNFVSKQRKTSTMRELKVFIVYPFSIHFLRFQQELYQSWFDLSGSRGKR
jgi:hypothetical protein